MSNTAAKETVTVHPTREENTEAAMGVSCTGWRYASTAGSWPARAMACTCCEVNMTKEKKLTSRPAREHMAERIDRQQGGD